LGENSTRAKNASVVDRTNNAKASSDLLGVGSFWSKGEGRERKEARVGEERKGGLPDVSLGPEFDERRGEDSMLRRGRGGGILRLGKLGSPSRW